MSTLIARATRTLIHKGPRAFTLRARERIAQKYHLWSRNDPWLLGLLVALRGNRAKVDGLRFDVGFPGIGMRQKSRFFHGDYEERERSLLRHTVDPSLPLVEFGGCIGVVSCLSNRLLADPTRHVVVEANPRMVPALRRNREINGCRFTIEHAALAYGSPSVKFHLHEYFVGGSVQRPTQESVEVPATTLGGILDRYGFDRACLISDCEGAEVELIRNEPDVLRERIASICLEYHPQISSEADVADLLARLQGLGFEVIGEAGICLAYRNRAFD